MNQFVFYFLHHDYCFAITVRCLGINMFGYYFRYEYMYQSDADTITTLKNFSGIVTTMCII